MIRIKYCTGCQERTPHQSGMWYWHIGIRLDWPDEVNGELDACLTCGFVRYRIVEYDEDDEFLRDIAISLS